MRKTSSWNFQRWAIILGAGGLFLLIGILATPDSTCAQAGGCKTLVIRFRAGVRAPGDYPLSFNLTWDAQQSQYVGSDSDGHRVTAGVGYTDKAVNIGANREGKDHGGLGCSYEFIGDAKGTNVYEGDWEGSSGCAWGYFHAELQGCAPPADSTLAPAAPSSHVVILSVSSPNPKLLDAQVIHQDGTEIDAVPGMTLLETDRVRTGYKNIMEIDWEGHATVQVPEMTEFKIGIFRLGNVNQMELWLAVGGVQASVNRLAAGRTLFSVKSQTVTASARGTQFSISYDEPKQVTTVSVTEDEVSIEPVNPALSPFVLQAGQEVQVGTDRVSAITAPTVSATAAPPSVSSNASSPSNNFALLALVLGGTVTIVLAFGLMGIVLVRRRSAPADRSARLLDLPESGKQGKSFVPTDLPERGAPMFAPPARLVVTHGRAMVPPADLSRGAATIGRDPASTLVVNDPEVSRQHARVAFVNGAWAITDLGSQNGTFVNGTRITRQGLRAGDQIQVGQTVIVFQCDAPAHAKPTNLPR